MSWTVLKPLPTSTASALVSAAVRVSPKGNAKINLFFSGTLYALLGKPRRATVSLGANENHGMIRLQFGPDGEFPVNQFLKDGGRINLQMIAGVAAKGARAQPCQIIDQAEYHLVLKLPLKEWEAAVQARLPTRAQGAQPLSPPIRRDDGKIDALGFLEGKGHNIKRLAHNRVMVDGETHAPPQLLRKINYHRSQAGLPEVVLDDLVLSA